MSWNFSGLSPYQDIERAIEQGRKFMTTLKMAQESYGGLIIGLTAPPYWDPTYSLQTYLLNKGMVCRMSEILTGFGLAYNIFTIHPNLTSPPIQGDDSNLGWYIDKDYRNMPLFLPDGSITREFESRAGRGLRDEIFLLKKLGFL